MVQMFEAGRASRAGAVLSGRENGEGRERRRSPPSSRSSSGSPAPRQRAIRRADAPRVLMTALPSTTSAQDRKGGAAFSPTRVARPLLWGGVEKRGASPARSVESVGSSSSCSQLSLRTLSPEPTVWIPEVEDTANHQDTNWPNQLMGWSNEFVREIGGSISKIGAMFENENHHEDVPNDQHKPLTETPEAKRVTSPQSLRPAFADSAPGGTVTRSMSSPDPATSSAWKRKSNLKQQIAFWRSKSAGANAKESQRRVTFADRPSLEAVISRQRAYAGPLTQMTATGPLSVSKHLTSCKCIQCEANHPSTQKIGNAL